MKIFRRLIFILIIFFSSQLISQRRIFLNSDYYIDLPAEFKENKTDVSELIKLLDNKEFEQTILKEQEYLSSQKSYNIINKNNPKSFINVNFSKIKIPTKIDNSQIKIDSEIGKYLLGYINSEIEKNFLTIAGVKADKIKETTIIQINKINVIIAELKTNIKIKSNDFLNSKSAILYLIQNDELITLSIDRTLENILVWDKIYEKLIKTLNVRNE